MKTSSTQNCVDIANILLKRLHELERAGNIYDWRVVSFSEKNGEAKLDINIIPKVSVEFIEIDFQIK